MDEDVFCSLGTRIAGRLKGFLQDDSCFVIADSESLGALKWNGSSFWLPGQRARLLNFNSLRGLLDAPSSTKKLKRFSTNIHILKTRI